MRLVLDTNTALSGLLWNGPPGRLIEAAQRQRVELASSTALLAELEGVMRRPKFKRQLARRGLHLTDLFDGYAALALHVTPATLAKPVCRDPDDDHVLACALGAQADAIVSGDDDLLALVSYQGIPILTATGILRRIQSR